MSASIPPDVDWLYPELLTKEGLIVILKQRYIQDVNLGEMDKEDLLGLYYKHILPLPQRRYRLNRRGKEMTKKQIISAKKRRLEWGDTDEPPTKKKSDVTSSRFMSSFDPSSSQSRLKPPPSCINFDKKVVKLTSAPKLTSPTSDSPSSTSVKGLTKKIVKITMNSAPLETKSSNDKSPETISLNKTVKLANSHDTKFTNPACNKVEDDMKNGGGDTKIKNVALEEHSQKQSVAESPKKKIKIKRISWP